MHNIHHLHPKFSIITVTYNAGATLEDTIQSVITQSYKNLEYIIVDGGSKDRTLGIIRQYRTHIHTIVSEPDRGLYDAMNKGIRLATGDYICFLNAGDELHEDDTLLMMVHSITGNVLPDVLYGETAIVRRDLVEPFDLSYRFSADFDWCIRIMKKSQTLHNTHLTLIDYLNEGMTTRNRKASLKERFRIMCKYYGYFPTILRHLGFAIRAVVKR